MGSLVQEEYEKIIENSNRSSRLVQQDRRMLEDKICSVTRDFLKVCGPMESSWIMTYLEIEGFKLDSQKLHRILKEKIKKINYGALEKIMDPRNSNSEDYKRENNLFYNRYSSTNISNKNHIIWFVWENVYEMKKHYLNLNKFSRMTSKKRDAWIDERIKEYLGKN